MDLRSYRLPRLELVLLSVFMILLGIGLATHEQWADELRAWIIARDVGFTSLYSALRDEFHPPGWYLILKVLQALGLPPGSMKLVTGGAMSAAFYLLLKFSPFTRFQKVLFVLNVYFLYQYGVNSRPYAIEILILFSLAASYHRRKEFVPAWITLIALLSITHAFGALIAPVLFLRVILDFLREKKRGYKILVGAAGAAIVLGSYFLLISPFTRELHGLMEHGPIFRQRFFQSLSFTVQSLFLLVPLEGPWWERSFWSAFSFPAQLSLVFIIPGLVLLFRVCRKDRYPFFFFSYGWLLIVFLHTYYKFSGFNLNHIGQVFLFLITTLWMAGVSGGRILNASLIVTAFTGAFMLLSDARNPYTSGPAVAEYISTKEKAALVSDIPYFSSAWLAYSDRRIVLDSGARVSFVQGDKEILTDMKIDPYFALTDYKGHPIHSSEDYLRRALTEAHCGSGTGTLLILNYWLKEDQLKRLCLALEKTFGRPINSMENFVIYRLESLPCTPGEKKLNCSFPGASDTGSEKRNSL